MLNKKITFMVVLLLFLSMGIVSATDNSTDTNTNSNLTHNSQAITTHENISKNITSNLDEKNITKKLNNNIGSDGQELGIIIPSIPPKYNNVPPKISGEMNITPIITVDCETLYHSEEITLNATILPLTVTGNLTFKLHTNGKNDTITLGTSRIKFGFGSITCIIPKTFKDESNETVVLDVYYSGTDTRYKNTSVSITNIVMEDKRPPSIDVNSFNGTVGDVVNFSANFTARNKSLGAPVALKINGITIARGKTTDGNFNLSYTLNPRMFAKGEYNVSFVCGETWTTSKKVFNTTLNVNAIDTLLSYNKTVVKAGDVVTLRVNLSNGNGYNVTSGKIGFKIDGTTYKNATGPLIVNVKNGIATFSFIANKNMIGTHNITFTYSGNYQFKDLRTTFTNAFTIEKGEIIQHNSKINYNNTTLIVNKKTTLNVSISDITGNYYSTTGLMGLKINGITYKDNNGNPIIAHIHNGIAQFEFKPTVNMIGIHNITFTFSGTQLLKSTRSTYTNALIIKTKN